MSDQEMRQLGCVATLHKLGEMGSDLIVLRKQLSALVTHANSAGQARISASLYKMVDDLQYLTLVGPDIVAALSEI